MNTVYNTLKNQIQITRRTYWSDSMVTISCIKAYKNQIQITRRTYWSDSMVTISCIKAYKNRVQEIRKNSIPEDC